MGTIDLSDAKILATWEQVAGTKDETNWMVLGYEGTKICVVKFGKGGLSEMTAVLQDDQVMYGILRVGAEDRKEGLTSVRSKTMMITWIGGSVGIMKKAKVGPQRQELINHIQGIQFFIPASEQSDVDMMHIASELLRSGGAHKPTHYLFGPGQEVALTDLNNFKSYV
jgi:hypothetical protein